MKKLVFDFDGVIRDLCTEVFGFYPDTWEYKVDGKNLIDIINTNLDILLSAPPTKYFKVISKLKHIKIYTAQQPYWNSLALSWIDYHLPNTNVDLIFTGPSIGDKLSKLQNDEYLVDDYPFFESYDRIFLIDYPYNRDTHCKYRIKRPSDLERIISRHTT